MILRGRKQLEGPKGVTNYESLHDENEHVENIKKEVPTPFNDVIDDVVYKSNEVPKDPKITSPKPYTPPLPFPQRIAKAKLDLQFVKFLEILKKLYMNIPFTDALSQMPSNAKVLKEIQSNKRKQGKHEIVAFTKECSATIQNKPLVKVKDPYSFSIPYLIGNVSATRALCDLGSSVSMMPLSMCEK